MANKNAKPPEHTKWKKGQASPNPGGRPALPEDVRKLARMNREDFSRFVNKYLAMTSNEIKESLKRSDATMLELMVGGIIEDAAKKKDHMKANWITEQVFGKLKDQIEVTTNFQALSDQELVTIGREAILMLTGGME